MTTTALNDKNKQTNFNIFLRKLQWILITHYLFFIVFISIIEDLKIQPGENAPILM